MNIPLYDPEEISLVAKIEPGYSEPVSEGMEDFSSSEDYIYNFVKEQLNSDNISEEKIMEEIQKLIRMKFDKKDTETDKRKQTVIMEDHERKTELSSSEIFSEMKPISETPTPDMKPTIPEMKSIQGEVSAPLTVEKKSAAKAVQQYQTMTSYSPQISQKPKGISTPYSTPSKKLMKKNFSNSPATETISQPSASIVRSVLNTRIPANIHNQETSPVVKSSSNQSSSSNYGYVFNNENEDSDAQENMIKVPKPNTIDPKEQAVYFLKQLSSSIDQVRESSLQSLLQLLQTKGMSVKELFPTICGEFANILQNFQVQEDTFNLTLLKAIGALHEGGRVFIKPLIKLLKDPMLYIFYDQIVESLFSLGSDSLSELVECASECNSDFDSFVLSHIANHPFVQQHILLGSLIRECKMQPSVVGGFASSESTNKQKKFAVEAIAKLGWRGTPAISTLLEMILTGALDRMLLVVALKTLGIEGEKQLIQLLQHPNPRIRECAAFSFGISTPMNPKLKIIVNAEATTYVTIPRINFVTYRNNQNEDDFFIMLDARDLISNTRRAITDGVFDTISASDYAVSDELTEFILDILYQQKREMGIPNNNKKSSTSTPSSPANAGKYSSAPEGMTTKIDEIEEASLDILRKHLKKQRETSEQADGKTMPNPENDTVNRIILFGGGITALGNALFDTEEVVRITASQTMGKIGLPEIEPIIASLTNALKDPSNRVRAAAVTAIGEILEKENNCGIPLTSSSKSHVANLINLRGMFPLLKDNFYNVRFACCLAMRNIGDKEANRKEISKAAVPILLKILKDGSINRKEVAHTIVSLGDFGTIELMSILKKESINSSKIRTSSAYGISYAQINSPLIDTVVECLFSTSKDKIPLVRRSVVRSLGVLSSRAQNSITYLRPRSLLPFLYNFLKDSEQCVREMAADVLASFGGPHGELLLIEGLLKDPNPLIRASAATGLLKIGPSTIRTLLLALYDKDPMVFKSVTTALETIGVSAIVDCLRMRPKKQKFSVVQAAKEILLCPYILPAKNLKVILQQIIRELDIDNENEDEIYDGMSESDSEFGGGENFQI